MKNNPNVDAIHRVLGETIVPYNAVQDFFERNDTSALVRMMKPLADCTEQHSPQKLFKLRTVSEKSLEALTDEKLYLTRADFFNDPYDCFLSFNHNKLKETISRHLSDESMNSFIKSSGLTFAAESGLINQTFYYHMFHLKRDAFFDICDEILTHTTTVLQSNTYIASLTENIQSPVLWAHYANNHEGFAIEYQFRKTMYCPHPVVMVDTGIQSTGWRSILPVYYSLTRADGTELAEWLALCKWHEFLFEEAHDKYDLSIFLPDLLLKTKLCLQKSVEWAYEQEWRMLVSYNWPNTIGAESATLFYPPSAIYLGDRISDENSSRLKQIANQKGIPVYRMAVDHSNYKYQLEIREE